mmetsp:Transcript_85655/g.239300  ORF Transcript_85655/g.239300 Transcript_85655/m.239300 type:complete len:242 (+) Transcript_85655:490-1215(+)
MGPLSASAALTSATTTWNWLWIFCVLLATNGVPGMNAFAWVLRLVFVGGAAEPSSTGTCPIVTHRPLLVLGAQAMESLSCRTVRAANASWRRSKSLQAAAHWPGGRQGNAGQCSEIPASVSVPTDSEPSASASPGASDDVDTSQSEGVLPADKPFKPASSSSDLVGPWAQESLNAGGTEVPFLPGHPWGCCPSSTSMKVFFTTTWNCSKASALRFAATLMCDGASSGYGACGFSPWVRNIS